MITKVMHHRFRLRNPLLRNPEMAEKIAEVFVSTKGVCQVQTNSLVGSILVVFDAKETNVKLILEDVKKGTGVDCNTWLTTNKERHLKNKSVRRFAKIGLAASLAGTLGTLAVSGKTHALAGSLFLFFIAAHSYNHRRTLFH